MRCYIYYHYLASQYGPRTSTVKVSRSSCCRRKTTYERGYLNNQINNSCFDTMIYIDLLTPKLYSDYSYNPYCDKFTRCQLFLDVDRGLQNTLIKATSHGDISFALIARNYSCCFKWVIYAIFLTKGCSCTPI